MIETSAAAGLLPLTHGTVTLTEEVHQMTSVAPFKGKADAVAKTLGEWPKPGEAFQTTSGHTILWSARGQAFVLGAPLDVKGNAATTDQSDAWAHLVLEGADMDAVLARLCPLDLNEAVFKRGTTARSLLGHMNALYYRVTATRMEIFVFRSMVHTAVHELDHAMRSVAARKTN